MTWMTKFREKSYRIPEWWEDKCDSALYYENEHRYEVRDNRGHFLTYYRDIEDLRSFIRGMGNRVGGVHCDYCNRHMDLDALLKER